MSVGQYDVVKAKEGGLLILDSLDSCGPSGKQLRPEESIAHGERSVNPSTMEFSHDESCAWNMNPHTMKSGRGACWQLWADWKLQQQLGGTRYLLFCYVERN